jgi:hypothetical protein
MEDSLRQILRDTQRVRPIPLFRYLSPPHFTNFFSFLDHFSILSFWFILYLYYIILIGGR